MPWAYSCYSSETNEVTVKIPFSSVDLAIKDDAWIGFVTAPLGGCWMLADGCQDG